MKRIGAKYLYALTGNGVLVDAFVDIDDSGRVINVGKIDGDVDEYFDGALVPGFVNSHCHIELSHLQGKFTKNSGMAGFIDQINALRDSQTREEKIVKLRAWIDKLWNDGVVAMADISNGDESFQSKLESPMYFRTFLEVFGTEPEECAGVMDYVNSLHKKAQDMGLDAGPTPHSCYTMSPELLSASAAAGLKTGAISYHSQESHEEEEMIVSGTGVMFENRVAAGMSTPKVYAKSSLQYFLDRLLDIQPGPFSQKVLLVHNICLSKDDVDAALKVLERPYWAICPLSNLFIHNQLPPLEMMVDKGLKICIGTDSLSSNDDLDMVKEIYCLRANFPAISLETMFGWACKNGADLLGKEAEFGTIQEGKKPGLVFIDGLDSNGDLTADSRSHKIV